MKQGLNKYLSIILLLLFIMVSSDAFAIITYASEVYSNGYFRYTVDDYSVTIISYNGKEKEVTVPNMIAGNPVNVIKKGAFADNKTVDVIHLPDTIMSVEEGAFGESQKVIYDYDNNDPGGGTLREEDSHQIENGNYEDKNKNMSNNNKSYIAVDNEENLVFINEDGTEVVLDDTRAYTSITDTEGNTVIKDSSGKTVDILTDGTIEYIDSNDNLIIFDTKTGSKTIEAPDGDYGYEEAQVDDPDIVSSEKSKPEISDTDKDKTIDVKRSKPENKQDKAEKNNKEENDKEENDKEEASITEGQEGAVRDNLPMITSIVIIVAMVILVYIVFVRGKNK